MRILLFGSWVAMVLACGACGGKTDTTPAGDSGLVDASSDGKPGGDTAPDFGKCTGPGACELVSRSCCGTCGAPTLADVIAIDRSEDSAYRSSICGPDPVGCPACAGRPNPNLQATCESGNCAVLDVRADAISACASDDDCQLRYADCCEACGAPAFGLIALRKDRAADYRAKVCAADVACPKCAVSYPASARAQCDATKHCVVTGVPGL